MRQVGIVVRDIEKAMRHWVEVCGVGPWFYAEQLPLDEFRYRARTYEGDAALVELAGELP